MCSMKDTQTRNFGLDSTTLLQELLETQSKLKSDPTNKSLARDCAIKSWHMCEHVFRQSHIQSEYTSLRGFQDHAKTDCPELAYMQDICNATKHVQITKYDPSIRSTELSGGFCPLGFSRGFDVRRLKIITGDNQKEDFLDAVDCVVQFWRSYHSVTDT